MGQDREDLTHFLVWRLRSLAQSTGASRSSLATIGFIHYLQGFRQASGEI